MEEQQLQQHQQQQQQEQQESFEHARASEPCAVEAEASSPKTFAAAEHGRTSVAACGGPPAGPQTGPEELSSGGNGVIEVAAADAAGGSSSCSSTTHIANKRKREEDTQEEEREDDREGGRMELEAEHGSDVACTRPEVTAAETFAAAVVPDDRLHGPQVSEEAPSGATTEFVESATAMVDSSSGTGKILEAANGDMPAKEAMESATAAATDIGQPHDGAACEGGVSPAVGEVPAPEVDGNTALHEPMAQSSEDCSATRETSGSAPPPPPPPPPPPLLQQQQDSEAHDSGVIADNSTGMESEVGGAAGVPAPPAASGRMLLWGPGPTAQVADACPATSPAGQPSPNAENADLGGPALPPPMFPPFCPSGQRVPSGPAAGMPQGMPQGASPAGVPYGGTFPMPPGMQQGMQQSMQQGMPTSVQMGIPSACGVQAVSGVPPGVLGLAARQPWLRPPGTAAPAGNFPSPPTLDPSLPPVAGSMTNGPDIFDVWDNYLAVYRRYAAELAAQALRGAAGRPDYEQPTSAALCAQAIGGARLEKVCVPYLNGQTCYRGFSCSDQHPADSKLRLLRKLQVSGQEALGTISSIPIENDNAEGGGSEAVAEPQNATGEKESAIPLGLPEAVPEAPGLP